MRGSFCNSCAVLDVALAVVLGHMPEAFVEALFTMDDGTTSFFKKTADQRWLAAVWHHLPQMHLSGGLPIYPVPNAIVLTYGSGDQKGMIEWNWQTKTKNSVADVVMGYICFFNVQEFLKKNLKPFRGKRGAPSNSSQGDLSSPHAPLLEAIYAGGRSRPLKTLSFSRATRTVRRISA